MKLVEVVATAESSRGGAGRRPPRSAGAWAARRSAPRTAPASSPTASPGPSRWSRCGCSPTGVADAPTIDRVVPARRRLPDGPVRADRPDRARRQPQRRPLLLRPGRRAGALAPERDPGADGRRRPARAARAASGFYTYERRAPHRERRSRPRRSRRRPSTPASWRRSTRPRAEILPRLVAQIANEAAFALEEEVGSPQDMDTAMRLGFNWPLRAAGVHRADRRRAARSTLLERLQASTARPTGRTRPARSRARELSVGAGRKPATEHTARPQPRGPRGAAARRRARTGGGAPRPGRRLRPAAGRGARRAARSGSSSPTTSSTRRRPRHRPPEPLAPVAGSTASPASSSWRRASSSCAASTSPTCTWSRAATGSSSSTRWSPPRPPPPRSRSTASTAASARSPA